MSKEEKLVNTDETTEEGYEETTEEVVEETSEVETETSDKTEEELPSSYTQDQVEGIVKTRVGTFNRKLEKLKPYEVAVKKISDITGMSVEALIARLEGMSDMEQAKVLGMTPQQFAERRRTLDTQNQANETTIQLQRQLEEQKLVIDPKYKDFSLYKEDVLELMDENPKLTMKQAYTLVKGDKAVEAAARDAEQRAVAKMTKSSNQKVVKPGMSTTKTPVKIDPAIAAAAKLVGMDPEEYRAYSNISDLDGYEKFRASKKG